MEIKAAPHRAGLLHVLRHKQRHLVHRLRRCRHPQHRHLVPLLQRRLQRPLIHNIGPQLLVSHVARQPDIDIALAGERHVHAPTAPYARMSYDFPGIKQLGLGEGSKAPLEQPSRVVSAFVGRGIPGNDRNQASAVLLSRGDDAVTCLLGEARLQSVEPGHLAEKRVAVDEPMLEVVELLQCKEFV